MNIGIGTLLILWFGLGLTFWGGFVLFRFGFRGRGDSAHRMAIREGGDVHPADATAGATARPTPVMSRSAH